MWRRPCFVRYLVIFLNDWCEGKWDILLNKRDYLYNREVFWFSFLLSFLRAVQNMRNREYLEIQIDNASNTVHSPTPHIVLAITMALGSPNSYESNPLLTLQSPRSRYHLTCTGAVECSRRHLSLWENFTYFCRVSSQGRPFVPLAWLKEGETWEDLAELAVAL